MFDFCAVLLECVFWSERTQHDTQALWLSEKLKREQLIVSMETGNLLPTPSAVTPRRQRQSRRVRWHTHTHTQCHKHTHLGNSGFSPSCLVVLPFLIWNHDQNINLYYSCQSDAIQCNSEIVIKMRHNFSKPNSDTLQIETLHKLALNCFKLYLQWLADMENEGDSTTEA